MSLLIVMFLRHSTDAEDRDMRTVYSSGRGETNCRVDRHEEKSNNTKADRHSRFLNSL